MAGRPRRVAWSRQTRVLKKGNLLMYRAALILLLFSPDLRADVVNSEWYSSARALSMGNTGIANAQDPATAMFYNPAALARNKNFNLELFSPHIEVGTGNFKLSKETGKQITNLELDNADPELQKNPGVASSASFSLYPNFYAQNFAIGVLVRYQTSAYRERHTNNLVYRARMVVIPSVGFSVSVLNGMFKLGVAPRLIQLTDNYRNTNSYKGTGYFKDASEGAGFAADAGVLWTVPAVGLPTLGLTARNIGDTSFPADNSLGIGETPQGKPDTVKSTYDAGFSWSPKMGRRSNATFAIDYRDLQNQSKTVLGRKLNFGLELDFNRWFFVRTGIRSGYWSAGVGFSGSLGALDIGSYADELDSQKFREVEDRRVFIRYGGRF